MTSPTSASTPSGIRWSFGRSVTMLMRVKCILLKQTRRDLLTFFLGSLHLHKLSQGRSGKDGPMRFVPPSSGLSMGYLKQGSPRSEPPSLTKANRAFTPCMSLLPCWVLRQICGSLTNRCCLYSLCSREEEVLPGMPSPVSHLPFGRATWSELVRLLRVDRDITRVIARQVAHFSSIRRNHSDEKTIGELKAQN